MPNTVKVLKLTTDVKKLFRVSSSMSNNGSQKIYPGKDFVIKK